MKTGKFRLLLTCLILAFGPEGWAQTASNYVSQGQSYLAISNLASANLSFSNAVAISPTDPNGNFFYAATRLLVLPTQPAGSNFLTRIGVPILGRSIYDWTAELPTDTNGIVLAPTGVNANEFTAQLRTNILISLSGAISNLNAITATNFTVNLTTSETTMPAVTVDYGDIKLIQSAMYAGEYIMPGQQNSWVN